MIDLVTKMLRNEIIIGYCHTNKRIKLKEDSTDSKIKELYINGFKSKPLAVKLDFDHSSPTIKHYSKSHPIINKLCDYVIFYDENDTIHIILIDLKSRSPKKKKASE